MSLMHDASQYGAFKDLVDDSGAPTVPAREYKMEVLELDISSSGDLNTPQLASTTISRIDRSHAPAIRVLFAPLDYPSAGTSSTLMALLERFKIPTTFLYERIQSVTHSFGFEEGQAGEFCSWFHFLCKAIEAKHDSFLWLKSAYFLCRDQRGKIILICFGTSVMLIQRLKMLPQTAWKSILASPFNLFAVVLGELHRQVDEQLWTLNRSVGDFERNFDQNWVDLHYVAKNIIHVKEASDAILHTISHMIREQSDSGVASRDEARKTNSALHYQESLFESVGLRAVSMEKRMQNVINLSFNLVAQQDSRTIKVESSSMHTIALTTLIFLPVSTVASIFGSAFFDFGGDNQNDFTWSRDFWIFWIVSVPLTLAVLTIWIYFHPSNFWRWPGLKRTRKYDREAYKMLESLHRF
ncbi:hypothetical protein LTR55_008677 [Exophiala xenobiotica]|nr:hypothetical protein LTR55_008677 [Exophiala xenobiotica]